MSPEAKGFLVGGIVGFGAIILAYKLAKPRVLESLRVRVVGIVRRSVNRGTNTILDAVGGDATLQIAANELVTLLDRELP